jgi:hypothetical protein
MKLTVLAFAAALLVSNAASAAQSGAEKTPAPQQAAAPRPSQQPGPDPFAGVPAAKPDDVKSIDAILAALYDVISGPPGERDWNRFRSLFLPSAHLISTGKAADGMPRLHVNSVEDYATHGGAYFLKNGFFERPIVNNVLTFGDIAHVFSSYESRHAASDVPFARGINSLQLFTDGKRWWIINILWDEERPDNPLPKEFATNPNA